MKKKMKVSKNPLPIKRNRTKKLVEKTSDVFKNVRTYVLYDKEDIKHIREQFKHIEGSEYRVNYTALVRTEKYTHKTIHIVIPLIYYNFPSEVTSASVEMNGQDIANKVKEIMELSNMKAKILLSELKKLKTFYGETESITYKHTFLNNIHKHP